MQDYYLTGRKVLIDMEIVTLYTNQDGIELFYDRESFFASYDNTGKEFEIKLAKCFVKPFNDDVVEVKGNAVLFNLKRCEHKEEAE